MMAVLVKKWRWVVVGILIGTSRRRTARRCWRRSRRCAGGAVKHYVFMMGNLNAGEARQLCRGRRVRLRPTARSSTPRTSTAWCSRCTSCSRCARASGRQHVLDHARVLDACDDAVDAAASTAAAAAVATTGRAAGRLARHRRPIADRHVARLVGGRGGGRRRRGDGRRARRRRDRRSCCRASAGWWRASARAPSSWRRAATAASRCARAGRARRRRRGPRGRGERVQRRGRSRRFTEILSVTQTHPKECTKIC